MAGSIYPSHTKKGRRWRALYRDAAGHQYVSEGFRRTSGLAGWQTAAIVAGSHGD
jgi:hypothetical protein